MMTILGLSKPEWLGVVKAVIGVLAVIGLLALSAVGGGGLL